MTTKEMPSLPFYAKIIERTSSALKLSISEIKEKYKEYPICIMDYIERDILEKSIEIRFDKEGITLTCIFDKDGNCEEVLLFHDNNELIEEFVAYLREYYDYSYIKSRFMLGRCYLKIKELKEPRNNIYLAFFQ